MKKIQLLYCVMAVVTGTLFANPIDPARGPFISEVFVQSPTKWYVELDTRYSRYFSATYPCTTSAYKFKLASSKKTYAIRFFVDSSKIAILTRASLVDAPVAETVAFAAIDTITISDTSTAYPCSWQFPVRQVAAGHSLYNDFVVNKIGDCPITKETGYVSIGVFGNPPEQYRKPFINEVQLQDSAHWAIELNYYFSGRPIYAKLPCTISSLKMQIANSSETYYVTARFDTNAVAVLRPSNVAAQPLIFKNLTFPTVILIYDTNYDSVLRSSNYWSFTLQKPIDSAHSWIDGGKVLTIRSNIGTRDPGYLTRYQLYFCDLQKKPVDGAFEYYLPATTECLFQQRHISSESFSTFAFLGDTTTKRWYSRDSIPKSSCVTKSSFTGTAWNACYIDSCETITDTIMLPDISTATRTIPKHIQEQPPRFFLVNQTGKHAVFSAMFTEKASFAQLRIVTLNGKLITTLPFGAITTPGTYSTEWSYGSVTGTGLFLGTLFIDGAPAQSQKIRIRK